MEKSRQSWPAYTEELCQIAHSADPVLSEEVVVKKVLSELRKFAKMHVKQTNPKTVQDVLQSLNEYSKEYGFAIQDEERREKQKN